MNTLKRFIGWLVFLNIGCVFLSTYGLITSGNPAHLLGIAANLFAIFLNYHYMLDLFEAKKVEVKNETNVR